jgi:hypothetical protein
MTTETIELEVDPETARRYREAAPEERKRVAQAVADGRLPFGRREAAANLWETVERISSEAARRVFTREALADTLSDDLSPGELERIFRKTP